jgi:NitT/TauT family transport system substrate-binding protein
MSRALKWPIFRAMQTDRDRPCEHGFRERPSLCTRSGEETTILLSAMLAYLGMDPQKEVNWISEQQGDAMGYFINGKADAFMAFASQPQELRAKKIGHVIVNTALDRPWSQYFCCVLLANREFVAKYPIATKRALRAFLKAADICARSPERAAQLLVDKGYEPRYG